MCLLHEEDKVNFVIFYFKRDLALTKGDFVVLVRQVDENWYEGQVKGSQGFLPSNYVEVSNFWFYILKFL